MKLSQIRANLNVLKFNSGLQVLFSYETPVAAFIPGTGHVMTDVYYSQTTSRHIGEWLSKEHAGIVEQSFIDNLVDQI